MADTWEARQDPDFRALIAEIVRDVSEVADRVLARFGNWLYCRQRVKGSALSSPEWRRIWHAYQARKVARPG